MNNRKLLLVILDGWGITDTPKYSAIDQADTPFLDKIYDSYPHAQLEASGRAVGLPQGQMGNSEVGHTNLGAGCVIPQELARIDQAIDEGKLHHNATLLKAFEYAKANDKKVHLMGLVSDGGIHSHIDHLKAICTVAHAQNLDKVFIHAFTDGRDSDPKSGLGFLQSLHEHLQHTTGQLASIMGRYYAMDRDKRWKRMLGAYDALTSGKGKQVLDWEGAMETFYASGVTDEFIPPTVIQKNQAEPVAVIEENDVVICFNFRTDRARQITQLLTQKKMTYTSPLPLYYVTLTTYDESFKNLHVVFKKESLKNTLGEIMSKHGKKQLRIAETEKYPHITYFLSGGREAPFDGESRILCPSPKVATYDLAPAMSAKAITKETVKAIEEGSHDFICLNFANADMVGHTGDMEATIQACTVVDQCLKEVIDTALQQNYVSLIVADHGNAESMKTGTGSPLTAHTCNPVPFILIDPSYHGSVQNGILADVAPTILQYMGLPIPSTMTGKSLLAPNSY